MKDPAIDGVSILASQDIPASSTEVNPAIGALSTVVGATNMFLMNKDTRFENLVFAITSGYASSPNPLAYMTDQEFAQKACSLARAIAFEMDKYSNL